MVTAKRPSIEENTRKLQEAWNKNASAALAALYAADAVVHDPMYPEPLKGKDAIKNDFEEFWKAFPDLQFKFSNTLAKGDTAAMQVNVAGTHKGPLPGPQGTIAATNKRMSMNVAVFVRYNAQGLVAEEHRYFDSSGMLKQLGISA